MERRAAVLGSPIAHSLSPALHRGAYAALGLKGWRYDAIACDEAGLPGLIAGLGPEWAGLSLTMPLKRAVLPLLDSVADLAVEVGGVNTVLLRDGARHGENTDVHGIVQALAESGVRAPRSATILGGGATAASALAALRELGLFEAALVVRDRTGARETEEAAERLGMRVTVETFDKLDVLLDVDLAVSTLPPGAADLYAPSLAGVPTVFDVVYTPWPTPLARAVAGAGGTVVSGFAMLVHQAVRQVELYTGLGRGVVPVDLVRAAGEAEIARRSARTD
ncbi:shikimate 5-dehydrogenase [Sphaerisporangium krabiense]|uniref:Shikimate dehydrogenase n=1 Tax=Sphaerisporangium krabiense TaxID=763782 RepID=A0A7W8ZBL6_9ACTN|nr:shikimate dehydrogenase [Sphaerisporangium krabiense]MBB5630890.1 shikimate dehydrogenase [Sphaerisporangium krabiense]GII65426.1 shikimate 5-dehydrogenase [Sphaerisporangium krabiense]